MKVLVVYYTLYGHTFQLARAVEAGARVVEGVEVILRRIPEFDDLDPVIDQEDIPVCAVDDFQEADGVILGTPTRYGNMTAQMKRVIDSTSRLWFNGEMEGKPAGVFTSTASTTVGRRRRC
jgi:NAD(P)H dehydrogenase (quinone)